QISFIDGPTIVRTPPMVSTLAGNGSEGYADGPGRSAEFNNPHGIAVAPDGTVYVADTFNQRIRKIQPDGIVSTLAGDGQAGVAIDAQGSRAQFQNPLGLALGHDGSLWVADMSNNRIRAIDPIGGGVLTVAGGGGGCWNGYGYRDGSDLSAAFHNPNWLAWTPDGLLVVDFTNNSIRRIGFHAGEGVTTFVGSGLDACSGAAGPSTPLDGPNGIAVAHDGTVYVAETNQNRIVAFDSAGTERIVAGDSQAGYADGKGDAARFDQPMGLAVGPAGNLFVADQGNNRIREITPDGIVSTLAGDGQPGYRDGLGAVAEFNRPESVAVGSDGKVYVTDRYNNRIRVIDR
ncbi:MAG: SMP-30/gluconolactonase/LRE family protein, partial [Cyanobacteria bacterium REEB65]|nr:SMP-30/gluconolactonase/LRE family protein [Cyanobacteria bacterium REEB65]